MMSPAGIADRQEGARRSDWLTTLADIAAGFMPWPKGAAVAALSTLYSFADEAGIHEGARFCVLAGYVASPEQWTEFDPAWGKALGPDISVFHSKRFFPRPGPGAHARLDALTAAITTHGAQPLGAIVDTEAFKALRYGERRFLTGGIWNHDKRKWLTSGAPSKPYFLLFQHCVREIAQRVPAAGRATFFFDRQEEFRSLALETFYVATGLLEEPERSRLGDCGFRPKATTTPLQAADMLAHCLFAHATKGEALTGARRYALDRLTAPWPSNTFPLYDTPSLEGLLGKLPENVREALRAQTEPKTPRQTKSRSDDRTSSCGT